MPVSVCVLSVSVSEASWIVALSITLSTSLSLFRHVTMKTLPRYTEQLVVALTPNCRALLTAAVSATRYLSR